MESWALLCWSELCEQITNNITFESILKTGEQTANTEYSNCWADCWTAAEEKFTLLSSAEEIIIVELIGGGGIKRSSLMA